ncbi:DNA polymerase IV [Alkalilimnicola ehrlichii]|uniref:DNA polymerase IV n=1 Tax=Alkalilimnicola ehrlichii TaxID=351052 RepID=A0A3E0X0T0_9GAMM|nr:DNA polymerase IV [Alkalilimnicola ehrlichii]RFA30697.1 DNA polymerase IV [Alkalilimnicola ehrlichii]RFA38275.1 DNA polymerase IV [Alkalilimnicola ehrlichii]
MTRKIIHIDMDAFYAAVEQRDDPRLRGRPVVVGGSPDSRGVVATASYEARRYGIRSAMPAARARLLCPEAVFLRPRFETYRKVSRQIQTIFRRYTALVEPLSLDEAYLDVSECRTCRGSATLIARRIKEEIYANTELRASAGVSYNKFLAKLASDIDKPDGLYLIAPDAGAKFVAELEIGRFHGVGRATEARMHALGIYTGADLRQWSLEELEAAFGKRGPFYYYIARGIDERPVRPVRERKSLGSETTFSRDLSDISAMLAALRPLAAEVLANLQKKQLLAYTFTLKVKFHDFQLITRAHSARAPVTDIEALMALLGALLERTEAVSKPVRLLGVTASGLRTASETEQQLGLF